MTTDAKIGLLLGLVFIVIIAFVINGLPSFHRDTRANDLTGKYVQQLGNQPAITDARQALDKIPTPGEVADESLKTTQPLVDSQSQPVAPQQVPQAVAIIETPLGDTNNSTSAAAPAEPAAQETIPATPEAQAASEVLTQVALEKQAPEAADQQPQAQQTSAKTYTVKKGDTIASIAYKFYGSEGRKKSCIDRIVKENKLKSAQQISIGQKLVIPSTRLDSTEPSFFEKVELMGKKTLGIDTETAKPAKVETAAAPVAAPEPAASNEYVVRAGDNPWKIASSQLGDGSRAKEILKLNPGIKSSQLSVGMRLKLPPR